MIAYLPNEVKQTEGTFAKREQLSTGLLTFTFRL